MNEFLLIFRRDLTKALASDPEQMQEVMKQWQDWMGGIAAQNKLVNHGNRLEDQGNVVNSDRMVTNGPFVEIKEAIAGYTIVRAESIEEASEMAKGCPVLLNGGNVEVRQIVAM